MYNKIVPVFDHISPSGIFIGYRDSIRNDGLTVPVFVTAKAKGSLAFVFGKYLRSKHWLVSRRQEGFVDEIVCLPEIYHNYSQA